MVDGSCSKKCQSNRDKDRVAFPFCKEHNCKHQEVNAAHMNSACSLTSCTTRHAIPQRPGSRDKSLLWGLLYVGGGGGLDILPSQTAGPRVVAGVRMLEEAKQRSLSEQLGINVNI
ncbi:hypothetical protein EYF80_006547 [Liparis tanakae]|uniref:Uncharacterized protein n=1 Tax=Liparis tanakae TaxID=230148 RepID=A0A4Z2J056_9TELE|nr:hypothetical protein EYF80_006547 [Liparis tanakae]